MKAKDERGVEISPDPDDFHDEGLVVYVHVPYTLNPRNPVLNPPSRLFYISVPAPFPCRFVPRDPDHLPELLAQAREAASAAAQDH